MRTVAEDAENQKADQECCQAPAIQFHICSDMQSSLLNRKFQVFHLSSRVSYLNKVPESFFHKQEACLCHIVRNRALSSNETAKTAAELHKYHAEAVTLHIL
jgi:hypothetical protein